MGIFNIFKKSAKPQIGWTIVGGQLVIGEDKSPTYIDKGYKGIPNLYAIINLITKKSATVPFEVFRVKNRSKLLKYQASMQSAYSAKDYVNAIRYKEDAMDKVDGSEIEGLLLTPNPTQSYYDLNECIDGYYLLTGNSYIYGLSPGFGKNALRPKELHCLVSPTVSVVANNYFDPVRAYKVGFMQDEIPKDQIAHLKHFNPLSSVSRPEDILYGLSPLASSRGLISKHEQADLAQGAAFKNLGIAGILSRDVNGDLTEEIAKSMQDNFEQFATGVSNFKKIKVTSANVKWQQIGVSPVDLGILEAKEEMLQELANIYSVPIGLLTKNNSTENNIIEGRKQLITDAVIPMVEKRKSALNRWLVPKFDPSLFIEMDYTVFPEMNDDLKDLVNSAIGMDWITPNEKRSLTKYDKHPDPLMDKIYMTSGKMPIEDVSMDVPDIVDDDFLIDETN